MATRKKAIVDEQESLESLFEGLKKDLSKIDPVTFAENYLTIDGKPFNLSSAGWRFLADVYRNVAIQAENPDSKPIVILKSRQIGATVMAAVLSLYFTASGLYSNNPGKPPIRILHLFPTIPLMHKYTKDKLEPMMRQSQNNYIANMALKSEQTGFVQDDTLTEKIFKGFSKLRIDAIGKDADRIRGLTQDGMFFDECLPFNTFIETEGGKKRIGTLCKLFKEGKKLPRVKTYNEKTGLFEFKKIINAAEKGERKLVKITIGNREIRATPNHKFLTSTGWEYAGKLSPGDLVVSSPATQQYIHALNKDQEQIVLGSFLGDGGITSHKQGRYRLRVIHGIAQSEYCKWKASLFKVETKDIGKNGYAQTPAVTFCTKSFGFREKFPNKKDHCPQWILDKLDARGLAIWFMDDGSSRKDKIGATISTCSFDEDSQKRIVEKLASFGIESRYRLHKGYYSIYLNKAGFRKLSAIIAPYVHENLSYKIYETEFGTYVWDSKYREHGYGIVDTVDDEEENKIVYDIEVEDNHNFIITSGASSKNLGGIVSHNCQDMNQTAIENALRILTMAQYGKKTKGIQCFFGTPKESGSYFWQLWNSSDQRFYQLRCISCDQYFFLYKYGSDEWKKIWIHGFTVKCPFCACEQDKRIAVDRGRWEPTTSSSEYQGYHINMLLSPLFTREVIDDYDPDKNQNRSIRAWKNESIGEFYSSGGMPLTFDDIVRTSLDTTRGVSRGVSEINDKIYTLGIDWGGKDLNSEFQGGQSYTAMVVLSAAPNGLFTIENAFRLKENSLTHRIKVVEELYDRYKIHTGAADFAYGNDVVNHLQIERDYRTKLLACINSGTLAKTLTYDPKSIRVTLNKNMMIEEIFSMIRQGKIRFPVRGTSWDQLLWLMKHCTSMEVKQVIRGDNYMKQYAKGSGPNDGLMAIMYAIVAYKFIATNGFAHRKEQHSGTGIPMPVLAYMPGLK